MHNELLNKFSQYNINLLGSGTSYYEKVAHENSINLAFCTLAIHCIFSWFFMLLFLYFLGIS